MASTTNLFNTPSIYCFISATSGDEKDEPLPMMVIILAAVGGLIFTILIIGMYTVITLPVVSRSFVRVLFLIRIILVAHLHITGKKSVMRKTAFRNSFQLHL